MEQDRRVELIDLAIQKFIHDNRNKDKGSQSQSLHNHNLSDHDTEYQLALSHLLSVSQLETLERDEIQKLSEASNPSELLASVVEQIGSEKVDGGCRGSESDEIIKELKKVKRQNFVTHCLLSVMIVLTVAWQLSEVSLILKVKNGLSNPFRSFGSMIKGMLKVPDMNGQEHDNNKEKPPESSSLPSLKVPEMPHMDIPSLGLHNGNQ